MKKVILNDSDFDKYEIMPHTSYFLTEIAEGYFTIKALDERGVKSSELIQKNSLKEYIKNEMLEKLNF